MIITLGLRVVCEKYMYSLVMQYNYFSDFLNIHVLVKRLKVSIYNSVPITDKMTIYSNSIRYSNWDISSTGCMIHVSLNYSLFPIIRRGIRVRNQNTNDYRIITGMITGL